jgi:uncharacterized protein YegJ (DUF2314 family)
MNISDKYIALANGEVKPASWIMAILPKEEDQPDVTSIMDILEASNFDVISIEHTEKSESESALWELLVKCRNNDESVSSFTIWVEHSERLEDLHQNWECVTEEEIENGNKSRYTFGISMVFSDDTLGDYHKQLKFIYTIAPQAILMIDIAACRPFSWSWVKETALSNVPPSPDNLFCIHAVYDEDEDTWLHTHGLLRCGSIELEILNASKDNASTLSILLNTAAIMMIEDGIPDALEPFEIGKDMDVLWMPWEEGIKKVAAKSQGSKNDRNDYHDHPSGILFAPGGFFKRYKHVSTYLSVLDDNPLLYISNLETERMSALAKERFNSFSKAMKLNTNEDWAFMVKLGYMVDEAESDDQREHLWFQVNDIKDESAIIATLLNEPYGIDRMHEGDQNEHSIENITDWVIYSSHGQFNAENINMLLEIQSQ